MNDIIKNYKQLVISKKIVIVYFFNEECIKTNNIYDNLKNNKNNNKNVLLLDYDVEKKDNQKLINIIDLKCYPYFFVYKNGKLIDQILGTLNVEKILGQYVCT